ncbi:p-hydroxybenzoic acid efflux pump subunit AaeB [Methylobacterium crusticola]|uniref:p-hydroxybenzoic acid efflux pump subunit AaeB n=1 Tax=Methylobacterium crusticola TaxID=1697972 RepID=A0ABQ4R8C7_9HYPH|nr:FUSC family protein [Methylobacterium crusticola]GJD53155.1 p-hydroxybenzoic acid efflux pump subunit AaeB [Methylobacterium crusticola]
MAGGLGRIAQDLLALRRMSAYRESRVRLAACTGLGGAGSVLLALALDLDEPWWAGITVVSILQGQVAATARRSLERAVGTGIGAAVAYALAPTVDHHLLFQLACAAVVIATVYGQERSPASYAVLLAGVTALLILFGTLAAPGQSLHLAVYRALEVLTGIAVGCLVDYVIGPTSAPQAPKPAAPGILARPVDADLLALAVVGGLIVALIPDIWETFQLPGLSQTPITAFVVVTAIRHDPWAKGVGRVVGCLLGGAYGLCAMSLVADAFLPWLACLAGGLFLAGMLQHGQGEAAYAGQQGAIALLVAMVQGPAASANVLPAVDRLAGIGGGIVAVTLLGAVLEPLRLWLRRRLEAAARSATGGP